MTQLCVVENPMRCNFMDLQVIENNFFNTLAQVMYGCKTTWVSLSFLVDCNALYLHIFHYWIYLQGIYYFFCCIITLIIISVLTGTTSHFKKNTIMYSELDKQYLLSVIICLHLLLYMLYSCILFLYHVYWHFQTGRKQKLICCLRVSYRRPCKYTYTALSIDLKIVSVSPTHCLNCIHNNFCCSIVILSWQYLELSDTHKRISCKLISANSTYHYHWIVTSWWSSYILAIHLLKMTILTAAPPAAFVSFIAMP